MSSAITGGPPFAAFAAMRRFSVSEYHRMIQAGILDEDDKVELLEGYVVLKMARNPPHDTALQRARKRIEALARVGWDVRVQCAVTLPDSEPEPDVAVARGDESTYAARYPDPDDLGLVVEVSEATLKRDQEDKQRIYARAGVVEYWIVNLVDRQVEVYTLPSGPAADPAYANKQVYPPGTSVPLSLNGTPLGQIAVDDLIR
jgi:Uma2 family endonuclease